VLDDLTVLGEDVNLAFPLVHVDANMVHGWPLLSAPLERGLSVGHFMPPRRVGVSRFIPSILSDVARYRVASALEMAKATFRAVFASDRPVSMNRPPTP
jgi:hypothetical protein